MWKVSSQAKQKNMSEANRTFRRRRDKERMSEASAKNPELLVAFSTKHHYFCISIRNRNGT